MALYRRRDARYSIQFPVQIVHAKRPLSLVTQDVSEGGIFAATDTPPPLMQLVHVQLVLPIGGRALSAHGMTVHVVLPKNEAGRVPGIGVQFYALDRSTRDAWEGFTRYVAANCPPSPDQTPLRLQRGITPEPLSRRFGAHKAVLELKPATLESLEDLYSNDIGMGSLTVPTDVRVDAGANVVIHVTHPVSHAPFLIEARVRHPVESPRGLRVDLLGVNARFREELLHFIRGPIVFDEEAVESSE
jgi:Tfp pilus assembly protein PilZ